MAIAIMTLTVQLAGGDPVEVSAHTRHQIQWERYARAHKIPPAPGPGFGATEYAAFLAYAAMRESGDAPDGFDTFVDRLDQIEAADPGPPDPTPAAAG